jgi:hypothetical protein
MRRKFIIVSFLLLLIIPVNIKSQGIEEIKSSKEYIWGEGQGATINRADAEAISQIASQISLQVQSNYSQQAEQIGWDDNAQFSQKVQSVINTYSTATLTNTERLIISNEPDAKVIRYIKRSEIYKVFAKRRSRIYDLLIDAKKFEEKNQISDAMKYYSWAYALILSHPEGTAMDTTIGGQKRLLITYVPTTMNEILGSLKILPTETNVENQIKTITLGIYRNNVPVDNFSYTYWDGRDWSNIYSAKDGDGIVELMGPLAVESPALKLKAECLFKGEAIVDREINAVLEQIDILPPKNSYFTLDLKKIQPVKQAIQVQPPSEEQKYIEKNISALKINDLQYADIVKLSVTALVKKQPTTVQQYFTPDGYDMFTKLISYGQGKVMDTSKIITLKMNNKVMCRPAKLLFSFNNSKNFVEDIVFYFDQNNKVECIAFCLNKKAADDIISKSVWSENDRMIIISFLESYKTAYALKRLDYLTSIFSDDAVIIVGYSVKVVPNAENNYQSKILKYNRLSKETYLKNLGTNFKSNDYINLEFEDNTVLKGKPRNGKGTIYGIQIKQNYYSSNYGDQGYLYLQVDLEEPDKPMIYVRTWQPEKGPNGEIYGIENF